MKVILYMAITANGYIATENDDTSWVSEEEWGSYRQITQRMGNIIIGRRTYEIMVEENTFGELDENLQVVVVTSDASFEVHNPDTVVTAPSPLKALNFLKKKGFKQILAAGGAKLNASFMKEGLIDELYLDVEPVVLGKGIPLFASGDFRFDLELLGVETLSPKTIQLHYKVRR